MLIFSNVSFQLENVQFIWTQEQNMSSSGGSANGSSFFSKLPRNSRIAAWGLAGVLFGAWQYYDAKRDNVAAPVDLYKEYGDHNSRIKEKTLPKKNP